MQASGCAGGWLLSEKEARGAHLPDAGQVPQCSVAPVVQRSDGGARAALRVKLHVGRAQPHKPGPWPGWWVVAVNRVGNEERVGTRTQRRRHRAGSDGAAAQMSRMTAGADAPGAGRHAR
jgi:hypothetical protein